MHHKHDFETVVVMDTTEPSDHPGPSKRARWTKARVKSAFMTGTVLAALWQVLNWGDPASWVIGLPSVLGGAFIGSAFPAPRAPRFQPIRLARFARFVVWGVLRGAFDVGLRSLRPSRLSPGILPYQTTLPEGAPRRTFTLLITLMPGTLTVRLDGADLSIHAMDRSPETFEELRALEHQIAALYGVTTDGAKS